MLLLALCELKLREDDELVSVGMTHGDLATLIAADRASATRVLHKLADEGYVELGYKSLALGKRILERDDLAHEVRTEFHRPW